jgi:hypothetical protein
MTHITDTMTASKIVAEFKAFKEVYDGYLDRVDELVCSLDPDSELFKRSRFLAVGTDDVTMFTVLGSGVVSRIEDMLNGETKA